MIRDFEINFPLRGVSENVSFDGQPPSTTRDANNVRSLDCRTGRARGAQRPGTSKWVDAQVSGDNPVVDLNQIITDDSQITYSQFSNLGIETVWEQAVPGPGTTGPVGYPTYDGEVGVDGNLYMLGDVNAFFVLSPEGKVLQNISIPVVSGSPRRLTVDDQLNVYVVISEGGTQSEARLWKFKPRLSDGLYDVDWELSLEKQTGTSLASVCYGMFLLAQDFKLYVAVDDAANSEGEIHVYSGLSLSTPPAAPDTSFAVTDTPRYIAVNDQNDIFVAWAGLTGEASDEQGFTKYDSGGSQLAAAASNSGALGDAEGGMGYCIALTSTGNIYTFGPAHSGGSANYVSHWSDDGTTFTQIWTETDSLADFNGNPGPFARISVDSKDNVYLPWPGVSASSAVSGWDTGGNENFSLAMSNIATSGVLLSNVRPDYGDDDVPVDEFLYSYGIYRSASTASISSSSNSDPIVITTAGAHGRSKGQQIYIEDHLVNLSANGRQTIGEIPTTTTFELANTHGIGTGGATGTFSRLESVFKARLVDSTLTSGSQRSLKTLAVANGNILVANVSGGSWDAPAGGGGSSALNTTGEFVQSTTLFNRMFWTDGQTYKVYVPEDDEVIDYIANVGEVPERCKLISSYRGRLVVARPADDGSDWFMSRVGDAFDWDFGAGVVARDVGSAVVGSSSDAGKVEDIINGLVPWNDDLMFFMGDHTIWRLSGDPLSSSGQIDNVSKTIGMAFGASWARDPHGMLYFFSTEGGVYRMPPDGIPKRISVDWIERRLQDVDLSTRNARLGWDYRREGLQIFLTARTGTSTTTQEHYFWEQKTGAWWPESRAATAGSAPTRPQEPRCLLSLDGDAPDDRVFLIGCEDGYVRKVDEDQRDDDSVAIGSRVLLGPFTARGVERLVRLVSMRMTLASKESGCNWKLYATSEPDVLGPVRAQGRLEPGRSPHILNARIQAEYFYVELQDFSVSSHWAFESGVMRMARGGRRR